MKPDQASQTAFVAAANRALESEKPADKRVCFDPLAKKFIGPVAYWRFKASLLLRQRRGYNLQEYILYRGRYFDDYQRTCLESGVTQVVNLGAGWDSHAYRGKILERGIRTFEVDHPATQAEKIRAVKRVFRTVPPHVVYVPVDLLGESLDKLLAYGFDPTARTLFLCEGVTYNLNAESINTVLAWIRTHAAERSAVILDYKFPYESSWTPRWNGRGTRGGAAGATREWRMYGILPGDAEEMLARNGFVRIHNVRAEELPNRYGAGGKLSRWGLNQHAIISAEVGKP